jgi:membrane protein DedA with SNARE-associated domain/membrane-associated phospholipid phosphatase
MDQIQPYLDYFAQHPDWALIVIFLIAFGEALLVIGLFVPSTAVLVGAGTLVGAGKLPFWPVIVATILGCIIGDQVSYWAGRLFGERLKTFWPLNRYPHLVAKGEEFFKKNGGKSIALGRFVPGVKAVVPGIAGMFGMNQIFFLVVNVTSGIVWGFAHVMPGVLLGQALSLAGELSGRLLFVLLILLVVLAVAGWLIRVLAASLTPYRLAAQGHIAHWANKQTSPIMHRFASAIAPENPRSMLVVMLIIGFVLAVIALIDILSGLFLRHAVGNFDLTLNNLFSELRSPPGDELMERLTMFGDELVLWTTIAAVIGWLAYQKAWRPAIAAGVTFIVARLIVLLASFSFSVPNATTMPSAYRFPSEHALLAGVVFGVIAVLCSHTMARWTQALVAATAAIIVIAISYTRLYLGVNWFSDVGGGLLIALILTSTFGVALATMRHLHIKPLGMLAVSSLAFLLAGGLHINTNFAASELAYAPQDKMITYPLLDWSNTNWSKLPARRIDIAGKPKELFIIQWIGSIDSLKAAVEKQKYKSFGTWSLRDSLLYLDPHAPLETLAPRPATHEGLKAKLTAVLPIVDKVPARLTLRAFQSNALAKDAGEQRVYLVSLTHETLHSQFNMFALPMGEQASIDEAKAFETALKSDPSIEVLGEKQLGGSAVVILKPKS